MFVFHSIKELLETLYKERELIDYLFNKRKSSVSYDDLLSYLEYDQDKLQRLLDSSILVRLGNSLELHHELLDFFEKFTDTTEEITVGYINDLIDALQLNLQLYAQEKRIVKKEEYLLKIKRNLRTVGKTILKNVNTLREKVEDVYATESSYAIKKLSLEDYDEKRRHIDVLLQQIEGLFGQPEWNFFVKVAQDDELLRILVALKKDLSVARKNLIDISQKILEFLNQIRRQAEMYKHIQKIKQLKDQFLLKEKTNFEEVLANEHGLLFQTMQRFSTPLSLAFLQQDEGYERILRVRRKTKAMMTGGMESAEAISAEYFDSGERVRTVIDFERLRQIFLARNENLFEFLMHYDFDEDLDTRERATIFCKMASLYRQDLNVTGQFGVHEQLEYAIVMPK